MNELEEFYNTQIIPQLPPRARKPFADLSESEKQRIQEMYGFAWFELGKRTDELWGKIIGPMNP